VAETGADPSMAIRKLKTHGFGSGSPVSALVLSLTWRSTRYVDHPGSLHPKANKAECCRCLGVLQCQNCGKTICPSTKTADMKAQMLRNCPDAMCCSALVWISCEAQTYHFVVEEDGLQYSVWEHTGSHRSHPCPPSGRWPPCSVPPPPQYPSQTIVQILALHKRQSKRVGSIAEMQGCQSSQRRQLLWHESFHNQTFYHFS